MTLASPPQLILTRDDVVSVAPSLRAINDIIEDTYRLSGLGQAEVPVKMGVHPGRAHSFLHAMPAFVSGAKALGVKWVSYYPGISSQGLPDASALIVLNDPEHGHPVAIMEGMWITSVRTAACGAVAARHLAKPTARRLGLVGCGGLGSWSLRMIADIFPGIEEVHVASKTQNSREQFCADAAQYGSWRMVPVDRIEDAVADMDIVVSSVPQGSERMIKGAWLSPGTLVSPLDVCSGWDDTAYGCVDWLVTDDVATLNSSVTTRRPDLDLPSDCVSVGDIILGQGPAIDREQSRCMFIPTGLASVDMTLAWEIYRRARAAGIGTEINLT
jgi:ornithine cyclodeaminase/alanine dehydrogenase-like protein (mu-crystallin family)